MPPRKTALAHVSYSWVTQRLARRNSHDETRWLLFAVLSAEGVKGLRSQNAFDNVSIVKASPTSLWTGLLGFTANVQLENWEIPVPRGPRSQFAPILTVLFALRLV